MAFSLEKSFGIFERACKVIPGGIIGHKHPAFTVPGSYPYFAERGEGSKYWDPDGNEYIDWMCGFGPMILGYKNPVVDAAVEKVRDLGDGMSHPSAISVEFAETLVKTIKGADWCVYGKNGADVTTWCTRVAREYTGRKKIIMATGAYHGAQAWSTPSHGGIIEEDRAHVHFCEFNNLDSVHKLVQQYKGQVACIILTPYHHILYADQVMPGPDWWQGIQKICREEDIVLISDDVRAAFRLSHAGSHDYFGYDPDFACFSKAIANTYPISACTGKDKFKKIAGEVLFTGTFFSSIQPMAAAIATINELKRLNAVDYMNRIGKMLWDGLIDRGKAYGFEVSMSGPYTIPFMRIVGDKNFLKKQLFSGEAARQGVIFHPHHNWFVSCAHTEEDVKKSIEVADNAFKVVKQKFGS
ncbi:MAG: aminotransferase class III-fold pyridoxal phosphate-dependent enzyme [bacterium]